MRSSSLKTAVATLTITVALVAIAPSAEARSQSSRKAPVVQREESLAAKAIRTIQRAMRRLVGGGVTTHGDGPSVPIPQGGPASDSEEFAPLPPGSEQ